MQLRVWVLGDLAKMRSATYDDVLDDVVEQANQQ